ncbi:hypothetical protein [Marinobacter zhejiangensis]|uniref:Uncharacterized protein n=1 Tax=Marinobacter zhejiangensis TaxID=488535 RepID=A0A1I4RY86_9GAMM|nr:hypothetical protein [Marinobacter zhejiangensis]SFM56923.1 hypothetical protein SAMN04487963_3008 [Marinobacter zhejiangensis]
MIWLKAFVSGFLATLIFHQGLFSLLYLAGRVSIEPFNFEPVPPFGIPAVVSLSLFGGLWGLALWALLRSATKAWFWLLAVVLGAIGPTAVAMLVVFPLKGLEVSQTTWIGGLLLNGAWGLGVAIFLTIMGTGRDRT